MREVDGIEILEQILRALTSFYFNVFLKTDILSQCLLLPLTKNVISYSFLLGQETIYNPSNTKFLIYLIITRKVFDSKLCL